MPLIRYKVDDIGSPLDGDCECGRSLPLMQVNVAKESDMIRLPNGEAHMSGDFLYLNKVLMERFPNAILEYRVRQKTLEDFYIEIVAGAGDTGRAEDLLEQLMQKQLGSHINIHYQRVDRLGRDKSGKLRYFISELNQ
jgi:phenylacetate-CoA ligase